MGKSFLREIPQSMSNKPIIAITMGDPAGIGPEVIVKALADPAIKKAARPLILGDWGVLQRVRRLSAEV